MRRISILHLNDLLRREFLYRGCRGFGTGAMVIVVEVSGGELVGDRDG